MQCWSARMMQNEGKKTLPEPNRQRTKDGFLMGFFFNNENHVYFRKWSQNLKTKNCQILESGLFFSIVLLFHLKHIKDLLQVSLLNQLNLKQ